MTLTPIRRAGRLLLVLVISGMAALPASAEAVDYVRTTGTLSDTDFYHLAACGARPEGDCQGPYVRWRPGTLRVAMLKPERGFSDERARRLSRALDRAIARINAAGAGIQLKRDDDRGTKAPIVVTPTRLIHGERTHRLTNINAGAVMGVGYMSIHWTPGHRITRAGIAIAADIRLDEMDSVVLEELFQTLGFVFDIDNSTYEGVSILSETSNRTTTITGQDRRILVMHYPPN